MKLSPKNKYPIKGYNHLGLIGLLTSLGCCLTSTVLAEINMAVLFEPPPESQQPESTESAASRQHGQCFQDISDNQPQESLKDSAKLMPIVPNGNFALTLSDRPNFWVYLPQTSAKQAILTIKEEGANPHWQQSVNLTGETGIVGIPLSDDAPALEIDKNYQWAMILVCGNMPNPNDPVVAAWIKRIDKSQISQRPSLNYSTELEKAADYAKQGIWYDALDILVAAKNSSVDNWQDNWVKYLQSGALDGITNKPILGVIGESYSR